LSISCVFVVKHNKLYKKSTTNQANGVRALQHNDGSLYAENRSIHSFFRIQYRRVTDRQTLDIPRCAYAWHTCRAVEAPTLIQTAVHMALSRSK